MSSEINLGRLTSSDDLPFNYLIKKNIKLYDKNDEEYYKRQIRLFDLMTLYSLYVGSFFLKTERPIIENFSLEEDRMNYDFEQIEILPEEVSDIFKKFGNLSVRKLDDNYVIKSSKNSEEIIELMNLLADINVNREQLDDLKAWIVFQVEKVLNYVINEIYTDEEGKEFYYDTYYGNVFSTVPFKNRMKQSKKISDGLFTGKCALLMQKIYGYRKIYGLSEREKFKIKHLITSDGASVADIIAEIFEEEEYNPNQKKNLNIIMGLFEEYINGKISDMRSSKPDAILIIKEKVYQEEMENIIFKYFSAKENKDKLKMIMKQDPSIKSARDFALRISKSFVFGNLELGTAEEGKQKSDIPGQPVNIVISNLDRNKMKANLMSIVKIIGVIILIAVVAVIAFALYKFFADMVPDYCDKNSPYYNQLLCPVESSWDEDTGRGEERHGGVRSEDGGFWGGYQRDVQEHKVKSKDPERQRIFASVTDLETISQDGTRSGSKGSLFVWTGGTRRLGTGFYDPEQERGRVRDVKQEQSVQTGWLTDVRGEGSQLEGELGLAVGYGARMMSVTPEEGGEEGKVTAKTTWGVAGISEGDVFGTKAGAMTVTSGYGDIGLLKEGPKGTYEAKATGFGVAARETEEGLEVSQFTGTLEGGQGYASIESDREKAEASGLGHIVTEKGGGLTTAGFTTRQTAKETGVTTESAVDVGKSAATSVSYKKGIGYKISKWLPEQQELGGLGGASGIDIIKTSDPTKAYVAGEEVVARALRGLDNKYSITFKENDWVWTPWEGGLTLYTLKKRVEDKLGIDVANLITSI